MNPIIETIVALATPPGRSAMGVVRMSGPDAEAILRRVCPELPAELRPGRARVAPVRRPATGEELDRVFGEFCVGKGKG